MSEKITTPADPEHHHYEWGASAAKQWRGCAGSIAFTRKKKAEGKIPEDNSTKYSREGTEAHDWADRYLRGEIKREDIPAVFREHLDGYLDLAEELIAEANQSHHVVFHEQQVPYFYNAEETGTLDFSIVSPPDDGDPGRIDILDLKYGEGVWVEADENDQLAIYALSLALALENDPEGFQFADETVVRMHIYQPRHRDFDGTPEVWETTLRDLKDIAIDIEADYQRSKESSPDDRTPSEDACRFCDARRVCEVRIGQLFEDIPEEMNPLAGDINIETIMSMEITDEVRRRIFEKGKAIAKFFEDTNTDTTALIEQGRHIEGLKTVDGGPGNRVWASEEDAEKLLRKLPANVRYKPRRVISPAVAEKVLKKIDVPFDKQSTRFKNRWEQLISRKEGKPTLALASDKKPARVPVAQQFDEEPTEPVHVETDISADDCF